MEGISHEAIGLAGMQKLNRLIVLWDDNNISIDGEIGLSDVTDQRARFAAAGWQVLSCDGHDPADIDRALTKAKTSDRPVMIACKTHIGYGAPASRTPRRRTARRSAPTSSPRCGRSTAGRMRPSRSPHR
jgi:transketolase